MSSSATSLFDACIPRDDVREGKLSESQFAAELSEVVFDPEEAPGIYADPETFFVKTYATDGLQRLLTLLAKRYVGTATGEFSGEDGFLSLDTVFGGGKSHSQIAAYHFSHAPESIPDLSAFIDDPDVLDAFESIIGELRVRTSVFEGGYVSATNAKCTDNADAPNTNTMWGELAYQLAGAEGYALFSDYDDNLIAPGAGDVRDLFDLLDDPGLVLIDEVAQYLEQTAAVGVGDSTLAAQTDSFLRSLIRSTQNTDKVTVVLSIAPTAFGDKAQQVQDLINDLDSISDRTEHSMTPTADDEVAPVLRHRLFKKVDPAAAPATADAYQRFYRKYEDELPDHVTTAEFRDRMERAYPFHPSLLELLAEEIDSLPDFQRTRGALKLVSRAVYRLWSQQEQHEQDEEQSHNETNGGRYWVRVYDMHPADSNVWSTLIDLFEQIEQDLRAASKSDIHTTDGVAACEYEDRNWLSKGHPPIATHVGTSILWKSIVTGGTRGRGVSRRKLWEMVLSPGVDLDHYRDALTNLNETGTDPDTEAFYLHETEAGLLRFKGEPKITKLIANEASQIEPGVARNRLEQTVRGALGGGEFETIYGPEAPYDVPDDADTVRLSVMAFDSVTIESDTDEPPELLQTLATTTGQSPGSEKKRICRNNVLFLVAGEGEIQTALKRARRLKAMERILEGQAWQTELNDSQRDDLTERREKTSALLGQSVRQSYRHLYYMSGDGLTNETLDSIQSGDGDDLHDIVYEALIDLDLLITRDENDLGTTWFANRVWTTNPDVMTTSEIRERIAKRPDVDILVHARPLRACIRNVVANGEYVYWDDTAGRGYCSATDSARGLPGDIALTDVEELSTGLTLSDTQISDDHVVYANADALLAAQNLTVPELEPEPEGGTGAEGGEGKISGGGGGEGDDVVTGSETITEHFEAGRPTPSSVTGAFSAASSDIDTTVQQVKDDHDLSMDELQVTVDTIDIEVEGNQVWERTWFISNAITDLDDLVDVTTVDFVYSTQTDAADANSSIFTAEYDGAVEAFATHLETNHIPTTLAGGRGETDGEAVFVMDTAVLEANTREETLTVLEEKLDRLSGLGNIGLHVTGRVEPVESAEVRA
jgi:hypothetical protein